MRETVTVELEGEMSFDFLPDVEPCGVEENALRLVLWDSICEVKPRDIDKAVALALRCVSVSIDGISEPVLPKDQLQVARIFYHMAHAHPEHWERLCAVLERQDG